MRSPAAAISWRTPGGYGFIVKSEELLTRIRAGKGFMTLQEGDEVLRPALVPDKPEMAVTLSEHGRMLLFPADELKELARGRGITLMGLDDGEKMTAVGFGDSKSVTVIGKSRSGSEKTVRVSGEDLQKHIVHRARKGCLLPGQDHPPAIKNGEGKKYPPPGGGPGRTQGTFSPGGRGPGGAGGGAKLFWGGGKARNSLESLNACNRILSRSRSAGAMSALSEPLFSIGEAIAVVVLLLAVYQFSGPLIRLRWRTQRMSARTLFLLLCAGLALVFAAAALRLFGFPWTRMPVIGYPIFWEIAGGALLALAAIALAVVALVPMRLRQPTAEHFLSGNQALIATGDDNALRELGHEIHEKASTWWRGNAARTATGRNGKGVWSRTLIRAYAFRCSTRGRARASAKRSCAGARRPSWRSSRG